MALVTTTETALAELFPAASKAGEGEGSVARSTGVLATDAAKHGHHLEVLCTTDQIVDVAQVLDGLGFFLESIAGVDWLDQGQFEVLYDFGRLGGEHCRVLVRVLVDRAHPVVPTITGVTPAADWHERETFDFYGIEFAGHPNLVRILLPEDADFFPLRKDYLP